MQIKSLEDLQKIREDSSHKINLRQHGENDGDTIEILVGMATCGISSGSRETLNAFVQTLANENITNVKVISVGCIGYCHSEPTVQINMPGELPVLYGNVKQEKVRQIIESHIKNGEPVKQLIIREGMDNND